MIQSHGACTITFPNGTTHQMVLLSDDEMVGGFFLVEQPERPTEIANPYNGAQLVTVTPFGRVTDEEFRFPITRLSAEDLESVGWSAEEIGRLGSRDLEAIARKMGEAYCESGAYWSDLEILTEDLRPE